MTPVSLPEQLGRYLLLRRLGRGGMGEVWSALDTELHREIALKVPAFPPHADPAVFERFKQEARLAASVRHPAFCPIYDVGLDQGFHYFVMELIDGPSLADFLHSGESWPLFDAARLVAVLASALEALHAQGIVHRDLKPANVMVRTTGELVLMDFGLARSFERLADESDYADDIGGTPAYMTPEQLAGDVNAVGPATDVWALGVLLYQLVAGRLPFAGSAAETCDKILHQEPAPPSTFRPDADTRLDGVCAQALAKEPRWRPPDMPALSELLRLALPEAAPPFPFAGMAPLSLPGRPGWEPTADTVRTMLQEPTPAEPAPAVVPGRPFRNSVGAEMRWVEPGSFTMGAADDDPHAHEDETPRHRVTMTRGFWMAAHPVTVGQFRQFVEGTQALLEAWKDPGWSQTERHPVVKVSWGDALAFCAWLSKSEGHIYDLATEAEWEYACRAGSESRYGYGDDEERLRDYAWYGANAGGQTHRVGRKRPNAWGLHDMHGNVWEWCKDARRAYAAEPVTDPDGGQDGELRMVRGGSWYSGRRGCRCTDRNSLAAANRDAYVGFRVVVRPWHEVGH